MSVSPVAKLNELIMARIQALPQYDVIDIKAGTHNNTFGTRVSCRIDKTGPVLTAEGMGSSKKESRSAAALNFMQMHLRDPIQKPLCLSRSSSTCSINVTNTNRHTVLQNFCATHKLKQPDFRDGEITGPPHARHFKAECIVSHYVTEGEGGTKSEAKMNASTKMLKVLMEENDLDKVEIKRNLQHTANKIGATLENVEKQLYDEIRNISDNRNNPQQKSVILLSHEFDVYIYYESKPKICEGTTICDDPSIRIAALTKLLMEMKEHAIGTANNIKIVDK